MQLHCLLDPSFTSKSQLVDKQATCQLEFTHCFKPFPKYRSCAVVLHTSQADILGTRKTLTLHICMSVNLAAVSKGILVNKDGEVNARCFSAQVACNRACSTLAHDKFHGLERLADAHVYQASCLVVAIPFPIRRQSPKPWQLVHTLWSC